MYLKEPNVNLFELLIAGLFGVVFCILIYSCNDGFSRDVTAEQAIVIDKTFKPAHTVTTLVPMGKVLVPQIIHRPDAWYLSVKTSKEICTKSVSESFYKSVGVDSKVFAHIGKGLIFSNRVCTRLTN